MISKACFRLGTSISAHRLTDRTNAPAGLVASRHYIVLLARSASQLEGPRQIAKEDRRELLSEFAWSSGIPKGATIYKSTPESLFQIWSQWVENLTKSRGSEKVPRRRFRRAAGSARSPWTLRRNCKGRACLEVEADADWPQLARFRGRATGMLNMWRTKSLDCHPNRHRIF